ncbi:Telomere repeat-binding factor 2 [Cardamine amara subsp. amara]|uniref:Telomere repeat-binding factor 2 n=1 Tax=Cardamine amara subsp. amara TaxID=228776 RepID=A0ABD1BMK3_CARAN
MDKWVAEFFLRRQQNPRVYATNLLSALKPVDSDDCVKLKITAVLRDISNSLIRGTVDEEMLDLLEILEKLLLQEHSVIMDSLKSAYCWTAAECTIRFMWPVNASDGFFSDALEMIWKKRIGMLKERESDLVTHELLKWESDFNKAFEEPELYQKIRETNIRYNAISHLTQLLKEQWALLGCSSLESEARKMFLKRKDPNAARKKGNNLGRAGDTIGNVSERRESRKGKVDKVNEQEQVHEASLNKGYITVARELKGYLLEIQRLLDPSTSQGQEPNNALDMSVNVTPQLDRANRTETEDSEGTSSSGRVRPHLPTPEPLNVSPLKKGRWEKPRPRRPMKFWTPEEVNALKEGVKEYGKSWKDIKNSNSVVLADRSEVDLKDKWRNLLGRQ